MSDKKISQLTAGGNAQATDELPIARAGTNVKVTGANIAAAATSVGTLTSLTVSGVTTLSAGTAAAPALTTSGDTNNGIFFPAADVTAITTAGTERLRVDASGNLGLGETTPSGFSSAANNFVIKETGGNAGMTIVTDSTNIGSIFFSDSTSANSQGQVRYDHLTDALTFGTNAAERARIDSSGNVQVGGTTAYGRLASYGNISTVGDGEAAGVALRSTSGRDSYGLFNINESASASALVFYWRDGNADPFGGTERMRINSSGTLAVSGSITEAGANIVSQTDIGSAANEIPLNQYLGTMAFQDAAFPTVGQLQRSYVVLANNTAAQALGTNFATQVGIDADTTLTTTVPPAGTNATVVIVTVGTSSRTVTFGTGFASTGTLATGVSADRRFVLTFISDGTRLLEVSRTTAITV